MDVRLTMVHFQLTLNCNLRCAFCGQDHTAPQSPVDWSALLRQLASYAPGCRIVLWGGEPLLYPEFDALCVRARAMGFPLELITNGTLINHHEEILRTCFEHIYISVDGPEPVHDTIRGAGVFSSVKKNMDLLRGGNAELCIMSVLTPETLNWVQEVPYGLAADRVILHELIGFSAEERRSVPGAMHWPEIPAGYPEQLQKTLTALKSHEFPVPVEFQPHFSGGDPCREPYRHLHIRASGETGFCTDFTSESMGNVAEESIRDIFEGRRASAFRTRSEAVFCSRCSWKNTRETILRFPLKKGGAIIPENFPFITTVNAAFRKEKKG